MLFRRVLLQLTIGYLTAVLVVVLFFFISSFFTLGDTASLPYSKAARFTQLTLAALAAALALGLFLLMLLKKHTANTKALVFYICYVLLFIVFVAPTVYFLVGVLVGFSATL